MGLEIPDEQIRSIVESDSLFEDAKVKGERFSLQKRKQTYRGLENFYGADLDGGLNWMLRNNSKIRLNPDLPGALI